MKPVSSWNFTPYTPLDRPERAEAPYVCQIQPKSCGFSAAFLDNGAASPTEHTLYYQKRGEPTETTVSAGTAYRVDVSGLAENTDYAFRIVRNSDGTASETRLVRTGALPGTVVNYLHPEDSVYGFSGRFLASPSLCRLPSGRLLSSMDVFEGNGGQNLTLLFASDDNGDTWSYLTELFPCFWGQLFYQNGRLYMLACSTEYGDLLIGASDDEGKTWGMPTVLFRGSSSPRERGLHKAPVPLLVSGGFLRTAVEYGAWAKKEKNNAVLSAPADCSDLTDPSVWRMTPFWRSALDPSYPKELGNALAIEGNVVEAPDGTLYNFLRFRQKLCLRLRIDPADREAPLSYTDTVSMDINTSKFEIHRDPVTSDYFALCSKAVDSPKTERNLLSLFRSSDLSHWRCVYNVLGSAELDPNMIGFQYVSFLFDGEDILFLSRTAYNNADNFHNSNAQTFHKIKDFRTL